MGLGAGLYVCTGFGAGLYVCTGFGAGLGAGLELVWELGWRWFGAGLGAVLKLVWELVWSWFGSCFGLPNGVPLGNQKLEFCMGGVGTCRKNMREAR